MDIDAEDEGAKAGLAEAKEQQGIQADIAAARTAAKKGEPQATLEAWRHVLGADPKHAEAQGGVKEAEHCLELDGYRQRREMPSKSDDTTTPSVHGSRCWTLNPKTMKPKRA